MMQRSVLRVLFGACLIGIAGISLTAGVLPVVISRLFETNSFEIMLLVRAFVIPLALVWAVCGGLIGWYGGVSLGGLSAGIYGAISGLVLGVFALGGGLAVIIVSMLAGLIYGGIAGLIVGKAFPNSIEEIQ